jgi:agmatinase
MAAPPTGAPLIEVRSIGDIACNPFDIEETVRTIQDGVAELAARAHRVVTLGGDHTIALPLLRELRARVGEPIALVHFDAHLDTWDTYFGAAYTHGTPFRRAAEEGLLADGACAHVGTRGPLYSRGDLDDDAKMGFGITTSDDFQRCGVDDIAQDVVARVRDRPVYVSVDIDVLDPAHAPGTGTPEAGGLTSRELFAVLRNLPGRQVCGADVVEVAPAYDHAQITAVAASHTVYELVTLMAAAARR